MHNTRASGNGPAAAAEDPRVAPASEMLRQTRIDLAAAHRLTVLEGLHEGTWNHFSATVPGRPGYLLLSPGQTHFSRVTASSLVMTDSEGNVVESTGVPNIGAWAIHAPLYRSRQDLTCALHVHSPYVTALASTEGWRLDTRGGQLAGVFHGNVAYFDYEGIVTEDDEGERMAEALGDNSTLIMANHGALVAAASIEVAMLHLISLERACMTEWMVRAVGGRIRRVPLEVAEAVAATAHEGFGERGYLDGMKAVLDHQGQDYAD